MAMTDTERILVYLRSISPRSATNAEILEGTGIEGRYQVYQLTQELMGEGRIRGVERDTGSLLEFVEPATAVCTGGKDDDQVLGDSTLRFHQARDLRQSVGV